jgi:hypothetical protein
MVVAFDIEHVVVVVEAHKLATIKPKARKSPF